VSPSILLAHHVRREAISEWYSMKKEEIDEDFGDGDGFIGCLIVCMCIFIVLGSVLWVILMIK
jgi:hypothetical protein